MTRCLLTAVMTLLAAGAWAGPADVNAGRDLEAWRGLTELPADRGAQVDGYRNFIATYPSSSLAEVAWDRLHQLDATDGDWRRAPQLRLHTQRLERSWLSHQQTLSRISTATGIAPLPADGRLPAEATAEPAPSLRLGQARAVRRVRIGQRPALRRRGADRQGR